MLRTDSEHAISASSKGVCHARTEEHIRGNAPKHATTSVGAIEVAIRLVERRVARHATCLLHRASQGRTYGGEVVK